MIEPATPANETERLQALYALQLLDTPREERFDRITRMAARLFNVPYAVISLVDAQRTWIKSTVGLSISEAPRCVSFCGHVVHGKDPLVISDALQDERFFDNPAVSGEPLIRFYAGYPLKTRTGFSVGTLCIIDTVPRELDEDERMTLRDLAEIAQVELNAMTTQSLMKGLLDSERKCREAQEYFQAFMDNTPCATFIKDQDGRYVFINRRFESAFLTSPDSMYGKRDEDFLPANAALQNREHDETTLAQGGAHEFLEILPTPDGQEHHWLTLRFPIPDPSGNLLIGGVAVDVTSQKETETALLESYVLQRTILESANASIMSCRPDGIIELFNPTAERWLGYEADEVIGKLTPAAFHDPVEVAVYKEELAANIGPSISPLEHFMAELHKGTVMEREWSMIRKDGTRFPIRLSITCLRNSSGAVTGYLSVGYDITEQQQAAEELLNAKTAAEQASQIKSLFLANMSHEVRTPLNGILGINAMLLETKLSPEQRRLAETVQESGVSLLTIVNDILDFSKVESGHLAVEDVDFHPRKLLAELRQLHAAKASAKGLIIESEITEEVPEQLRADSARIRQVLNNLLSNSLKFSDRGTVRIRMSMTPADDGEYGRLQFSVSDKGIGIPPEVQDRIFDPFQQADYSTTRKYGGTGLGLSICRQLVELMNGKIGLTSEPGEGSTFWFSIPVHLAENAEPEALPAAADTEPNGFDGLRVLIAEDSSVNQLVILHALRKLGCHAETVSNGKLAVEAWERGQWDVILMDCQMPVLDGYEAAMLIRQGEAQRGVLAPVPIIAVTANAMKGEKERCIACGMDDHISKPFHQEKLRISLSKYAQPLGAPVISEPAVDEELLDSLRAETEEMGSAFFERLVAAFQEEAEDSLVALRNAAAERNGAAMHSAAHKLKGSGGNFGARRLRELCVAVETHATAGAVEHAAGILPALQKELDRVLAALAPVS